ncbi:zinc finger protein 862-like [Eriocheir sinensis]|uniref:zinc finger protein 862-like n=2 Tax=Eriocheir sinensis TaxID=95602 RepID=UPI0021C9F71A|nr:zinc finger protein 862-like [Eriocheir sinensis]
MSDIRQVRPHDSDSDDEGPQTPKKKVKYDHKFQLKLLSDPKFSPWMIQSKKNPNKAFCTACDSELSGSITLLERHNLTEKHKKNMNASNQHKKVTNYFQPSVSASFEKQVVASELKMCAFIAEHNLPVSVMDHLPGFIANVCPDSKIASAVKCGRTKASAILGNVMGDAFLSEIVARLKDTKFSLIIDESTDLSTQKHLVLIARFYDLEVQKTCDHFLSLLEVTDCTAQGIFSSIVQFFDRHLIPMKNVIGFASDNASVMMGEKGGVMALLRKENPSLFVQGCVCHSIALCASNACGELPNRVEELARNIHTYIMNSPKRFTEYEEFQKFTEAPLHRILHPSFTRWLSLEEVVKRVLEQWPTLKLYFTSAALEDKMASASAILQELHNPVIKMYFSFLAYILPAVNKLNLDFQATSLRIHKLRTSISSSVKGILSNFMKADKLKAVI